MDVLSTVLQTVKLECAIFNNAEFSEPWCFRVPDTCTLWPHLAEKRKHVIMYHFITQGRAYAQLESGPRIPISAGDIVVLPHGDKHIMGNGREVEPVDAPLSDGLRLARMGGGGEPTRVICGYLLCDPQLSLSFLSGLPPMFKVTITDTASGQWLENSIRYAVQQASESQVGSQVVLAKLSEALFAETLRRYVECLPPEQTGWLAGARDADVGNALALLHREPGSCWTIAKLAKAVGVSRSVLAERFRHFLGLPAMSYLTRWRMQLGAQLLTSTSRSVAQIASEIGYESESAFNRAFKREYGTPPARFRSQTKSTPAPAGNTSARELTANPDANIKNSAVAARQSA
jgi:AraC-like DNA-binding protein